MIDRISVPAHVCESWRGKHTQKQSFVHRIDFLGCIKLYFEYIRLNGKQICVCQQTNLKHAMLYAFSYGMASASVRRSRLAKAAPVWKYHKDSSTNAFNKPCLFLVHTSKTRQCTPQILIVQSHQMASVQKETQPGLGCCCSKAKSIITHRHAQ